MLYFTSFFIELFILFLLSRKLTRILSQFLFRISKSQRFTITAIAILFFPGTVIHEFAHALFARLLGVHVGKIEFMPTVQGDTVKLGSVQIAHTDPFRRFIIGVAPFFLGTTLLISLLFAFVQNQLFTNYLVVLLVGYAVFEIGNTMFSSRKDMEGAIELFTGIILLIIIFYLLGIRMPTSNPNLLLSQPLVQEVFQQGSVFLLVPLAIDAFIILLLRPLHRE